MTYCWDWGAGELKASYFDYQLSFAVALEFTPPLPPP